MSAALQPLIKWSGSKRRVARALHALWPEVCSSARYFEPFVGSGAMLPGRPVKAAVAGDVIGPLIALWRCLQSNPDEVVAHYRALWSERQRRGHEVFYEARERFNQSGSPLDFLVLSRMCVNGLIRFNSKGHFNNSLHHTRPGIHPDRLASIVHAWRLCLATVSFQVADYEETLVGVGAGDLVFLDPPYAGTRGRYKPEPFDLERFQGVLERLNQRGAHWMLTFDGEAGARVYGDGVIASELYRHRSTLETGHSPFTRLMKRSVDSVNEALYLNFDPSASVG